MEPNQKSAEELCKEAKKLYGEKKFKEAYGLWTSAAEENHAEALYMLGICYNYNLGVDEPDEEKRGVRASEYFIKAADLGHADAQCFAALCFLHGIGVEEDEVKAVELFRKSAESNCTQAMNNLGLLCD
ncbi:MAG: sel1 repeat family protein, partial [Clostridia bacterium]|nr:sel1 repeat family protein [Clostridia bacterium]